MIRLRTTIRVALMIVGISFGCSAAAASDGRALHERIDRLLAAARSQYPGMVSDRSSDAEFLRRISLDLIGTVPSVSDVRSFLDDDSPSPDKRRRLIDRLLADPRYGRRMQYVFDEILMERRAASAIPEKDWRAYLRESFQQNKPWDQLTGEILAADGAHEQLRPAARFYLDRNVDLDLITRDVGRVFLGVDLECAQCHDHPYIDDYPQRYYYGINAFLSRSYLFTDPKSKQKQLGEKAEGDVKFTSVFTNEESGTNPRLLDLPEIADPEGMQKLYTVAPDKKARGVPKYSRRDQLARVMVSKDNLAFSRNIVNRLWALMMGRGLVEPLDVWHADNPPSHPELLNLLAREFVSHGYDMQWLLRELALSDTYQRGSHVTGRRHEDAAKFYAVGMLKPLSPEQLAWSVMQATGVVDQTLAAQVAELAKKDQDAAAVQADDPKWREETLRIALKAGIDQFVTRFSVIGGQSTSFDSSASHALFLRNGELVQNWLVPNQGNLTDRLRQPGAAVAFAEELYLAVLNRRPSGPETNEVAEWIDSCGNREQAATDLTWALLSSPEFRFNH